MKETREAIMSTALRHFCAMDYAVVNLEAIARDANVTRAPLYYYFKNKEGLYRAVVEASLSEARSNMEALLGAEENVFEIIRKEYIYCIYGLGQYRMIWYPGPGAPDCSVQIQSFEQWLVNRKLEVFSAARDRGELRPDCDVSEIVTFIYVFYYGILDTQQRAARLEGFNRPILDTSEDWFLDIMRAKYAPEG